MEEETKQKNRQLHMKTNPEIMPKILRGKVDGGGGGGGVEGETVHKNFCLEILAFHWWVEYSSIVNRKQYYYKP